MEAMPQRFYNKLNDNIDAMLSIMGHSIDFTYRVVRMANNQRAALIYLDGMVDMQAMQDGVIRPIMERALVQDNVLDHMKDQVLESGNASYAHSMPDALEKIIAGSLLVLVEGVHTGLLISLPGWEERAVTESTTQSVVHGPQNAFTENVRTNITLVRRRVRDLRVRISSVTVGTMTKTDVAVMYINGVAEQKLVNDLLAKLGEVKQDGIFDGRYLEELITERKRQTVFPTFFNTDRPDSIAAGMLEGKIAIFVDGTPFVLLVPAFFTDFLQSPEDYYQPYLFSSLMRLLRYAALFVCLIAPAAYISLTTFHQDMLPTPLLLSLAAQRENVPFPAFIEAFIMEVIFEILREAGIRMPRTIGQAVSIVGSIVIGQAAVEAGIVSAAMVIVVAITAMSSFVIPSYSMSIAIRVLRFLFMIIASLYGVYGLTIGVILLIVHLCGVQSFGMPYMSPFAPYKKGAQRDALIRFPYRSGSR